ncbi:hypothetical protein [Anoxybacteroides tepidamans]|uniref:hypothetical protein n=1 Tax=Anoxybacteroides tepidamans TaxID=265948 RepID=UPI000487EBA7|nr:hypothetical protein [Anoxybacillus tepidamans]
MYRVFFHNRPLKKRANLMGRAAKTFESPKPSETANSILSQLEALQPGTEINVHTDNETYYNALFQSFDQETGDVSLLIDRFYKDGGRVATLRGSDIVSIDFPASENEEGFPINSNADEEDE